MKRSLLFVCLLLSAQSLFAWGQNGHRIVAQICYDNLNEKTKAEIDDILGDNYLSQIATWPDFIRSEKAWDFTKPWHFITIDTFKTVSQVIEEAAENPEIDNVVEAIEFMKNILAGDIQATNKFQELMDENGVKPLEGSIKITALAFLVHFIGDVHQPMHVGKGNDYGGNKIKVFFFDELSNLHSVWDEGIIEQEGLSYTELADFVDKHTSPKKADWQKDPLKIWVQESVDYRETIYHYKTDKDKETGLPSLSYNYQHDFIETVENRLGAGGFRAAAVLNSIFK